jgi:hypothetical protein
LRRLGIGIVVGFAASVAVFTIPGAFLLLLIFGMYAWRVLAVIVVFLVVVAARAGRWKLLAEVAIGTAIVAVLASLPQPSDSFTSRASWLVVLAVHSHELRAAADAERRAGNPRPVVAISTDGFGSMTSGIAYDPSGEIMFPAARRSAGWKAAVGQSELGVTDFVARPILGAYYSWFHY